jgi:hypothetical protein
VRIRDCISKPKGVREQKSLGNTDLNCHFHIICVEAEITVRVVRRLQNGLLLTRASIHGRGKTGCAAHSSSAVSTGDKAAGT